jgi:hypothetical protein
MALRQFCANESCPKHTVASGGTFRYSEERRAWFCKDCFFVPAVMNDCKELYSFTTTMLDGTPIDVRGKSHLRQIEQLYGVSHHMLNNDQSHWDR